MRPIASPGTSVILPAAVKTGLTIWNRRLLVLAAVVIAAGATMLALQAAGPNVRAMIAGEGTIVSQPE
jgi:hypothetical protein